MGESEFLFRAVAGLWLAGCLTVAVYRWSGAVLPSAGLPVRLAAAGVLGLWVSTAGFHLLLSFGLFRLGPALTAAALLLLLALFLPRSGPSLAGRLRGDLRYLGRFTRAVLRSRGRLVTLLLLACGALVVVRTLVLPPLAWDTLTYHGPRAALWVRTGQLTFDPAPGPWSLYRTFFAGSEVLLSWALLPFSSDLLAGLAGAVQWLGVGLAAWVLARELGVRPRAAAASVAASMFVPTLQLAAGTGYGEPVLAMALLSGVAFSLRALRRREAPSLLLAAASLGVAAGVKVPGVLPGLVAAAAVGLGTLLDPALRLRRRLGLLLAAGALAAAPSVPWLLLAWRETGAPLSPLPLRVLGVRLGIPDPAMRWYADRPGLVAYVPAAELRALAAVFPLPGTRTEGLGLPYALPLLLAPAAFVLLARRSLVPAAVVFGGVGVVLVFYLSPALTVSRILWAGNVSRYLLPAVLLAVPLCLSAARPRLCGVLRWFLLATAGWYALTFAGIGWTAAEALFALAVLAAVSAATGAVAGLSRLARPLAAPAALVLLVALLAGLRAGRDATRTAALSEAFQLHWRPTYWAEVVPLVDDPRRELRIAVTSGPFQNADNWFVLPFLGRELQNRVAYVPVSSDGSVVPFGTDGALERGADRDAWLRRLRASGVTHVMSFVPASVELSWMAKDPGRFRRLTGGAEWGLFEVVRGGRE